MAEITYETFQDESQLRHLIALIENDLSEPYSIYTYRYFLHSWPSLCFIAKCHTEHIGVIICRLEMHRGVNRGYIAMLAVAPAYRQQKIGSKLATMAIHAMRRDGAEEIVLETEVNNLSALAFYERLGFIRDKRLHRFYLNGIDAFRLKLWTPPTVIKH